MTLGRTLCIALLAAVYLAAEPPLLAQPPRPGPDPDNKVSSMFRGMMRVPSVLPAGRFADVAHDAERELILISSPSSNKIDVIYASNSDPRALGSRMTITDVTNPQGLLLVPEHDNLYVASGLDGTISIFKPNQTGYEVQQTVKCKRNARALAYDKKRDTVYVAYVKGLARIDAGSITKADDDLRLEGTPSDILIDADNDRAYVAITRSTEGRHIAVVDLASWEVESTWKIEPDRDIDALALARDGGRLYVSSSGTDAVLSIDTQTGGRAGSIDTHANPGDVRVDNEMNRLYVACGRGFIDVFDLSTDADSPEKLGSFETMPGATLLTFNQTTRIGLMPIPALGTEGARVMVYYVSR